MRGRKRKKKIFMGVVTYELWRTGGGVVKRSQVLRLIYIYIATPAAQIKGGG